TRRVAPQLRVRGGAAFPHARSVDITVSGVGSRGPGSAMAAQWKEVAGGLGLRARLLFSSARRRPGCPLPGHPAVGGRREPVTKSLRRAARSTVVVVGAFSAL